MTEQDLALIKQSIATVVDYPKPGIMFRDVTSLMQDAEAFELTLKHMAAPFVGQGFTKVVGTESRGFIFGAPLARELGIGFVPVRKPGKLPRDVISETYELEYGQDVLEIHTDAITADDKVLMVDDLLATGGTIEATAKLIRRLGGRADHASFVISLPDIGGEKRLEAMDISMHYLVKFDGE